MSWPAHVSSRRPLLGLLLLVACLGVPAGGCREEGTIEVKDITLTGTTQIDEGRLKGALVTRESSRLPWGTKQYFDRSRFDADLKRITAFYADRGFPDARIRSVDVKLNDAQDAVSITIAIDEGEPVTVTGIQYEGFDVLPERALRRLRRSNALAEGQPLDRQAFAATRDAGIDALREHGYPYATVAASDRAQGDPKHVVVTYTASPGPLASFGPIEVVGEASVGEEIILRELHYKPGDRYRRSRLLDSQRSLYDLELFQFANVEPITGETPDPIVPTRVTVAEGKHRRVHFGVGYGTEEKARVDTEWRHANFFGGARTADVSARWSSLDRGVKGDFTQPYFLGQHFSLGLNGIAWNASEPAYSTDTFGGRITLRYQPTRRFSAAVAFVGEYERSAISDAALEDLSLRDELIALGLDPTDGTQNGTRYGFDVDLQRNTTPNLLDARRGYFAALHLEQSGGFLPGSFDYYSVSGDLRHYLPLDRRAVWANRLQFGGIESTRAEGDPLGSASIPFGKRYFLGGSTSIRGWGRYDVSPLSGSGLPIGGLSLLEVSSELRLRVTQKLSIVAFLDAGNVWDESWEYHLDDLRYAAGPGVRYQTPIGPVRMDIGYQLNPIEGLLVDGEPEKRHWRVHFSIGQAF